MHRRQEEVNTNARQRRAWSISYPLDVWEPRDDASSEPRFSSSKQCADPTYDMAVEWTKDELIVFCRRIAGITRAAEGVISSYGPGNGKVWVHVRREDPVVLRQLHTTVPEDALHIVVVDEQFYGLPAGVRPDDLQHSGD